MWCWRLHATLLMFLLPACAAWAQDYDGPLGGAPVGGGSVEEYQAIGGEPVYGVQEWDPPIGGEPVYGEPVEEDEPIGGEMVDGEPVEDDQPIEGAPVEGDDAAGDAPVDDDGGDEPVE